LNTQVLGISIDHVPCLEAWAEHMGGISFPLLSDFWIHGEVAKLYGVLTDEGFSERAIFLVDKDGIIQYIDVHDIDGQPKNEILFKLLEKMDGTNQISAPVVEKQFEIPDAPVVMFCTSWCPDCDVARDWLKSNQVEFVEVNVNQHPEAAQLVRKWAKGNLTTPTFKVGEHIVVDLDLEQLKKLV
jgi:glutaredoxin